MTMPPSTEPTQSETSADVYESLNLYEIWNRIARGMAQIAGLAVLGVVAAYLFFLAANTSSTVATTVHVSFSFPGFERGQYPDGSKFHPDDLRASEVVSEALKRGGFDGSGDLQAKIQNGLSIEALIPPDIVRQRDRSLAEGQVLGPYYADEYVVTLNLPRRVPLTAKEREVLLSNIVNVYQQHFESTYSDVPAPFANVFDTLHGSDFTDYELVLTKDLQNISSYLTLQFNRVPAFRSITTGLSFGDLLEQTELFTQVNVDPVLGDIYFQGISRNRQSALTKIDYYLHVLAGQENKAVEEEKVIQDLLAKSQERTQNYVLGIKSTSSQPHPEGPILDQGLIDSLLANDAYSFLVRKDLDAGMKVKDLQAEQTRLAARRKQLESVAEGSATDNNQAAKWGEIEKALALVEKQYALLISNIVKTNSDFGHQEFADAVRISKNAQTDAPTRGFLFFCGIGLSLGAVCGIGLSLLGIYLGPTIRPR
jgi:hypothetical protein